MSAEPQYPLLDTIHDAADVRRLKIDALPQLCDEVRRYLIDTVSKTAGHLASGLGVVELTCALHYVFNTPQDKIIWDVGHQAYPHKILTGHKKELATIRQKDGLHAFIWRGETPYDVLSTGHASTSIGSALGLALAARAQGRPDRVAAVIGDGSLTGGMAFEALNHAGTFKDLNLLVILNDNEMSISENVGSLAQSLAEVLANPHYVKLVEGGKRVLTKLPALREFALRAQEHAKGMVMPGTLFEEFGFNYIGPVDGNNVLRLTSLLRKIKDLPGLQFLHVVTRKGKGYPPAERDPICYHGVPAFDPEAGVPQTPHPNDKSFSRAFGNWLCAQANKDPLLVGITPAMRVGSAMDDFAAKFPERFYDVGIAEQHAVVLASGLAAGGMHPVVALYSSFLQRAYDSVIHDCAIQDLPIVLAVDRGGIVGPDGPTHQGAYDLAYLRAVPNLTILTPATLSEQEQMLSFAAALGHPCAVRYPRASGRDELPGGLQQDEITLGRAQVLHTAPETAGKRAAVLAFGPMAADLLPLAQEQGFTLVNMRFVKPLDTELILELARTHDLIVSVEEGTLSGGIGEEIALTLENADCPTRFRALGLPDHFIMEGSRAQILQDLGLTPDQIAACVERELQAMD